MILPAGRAGPVVHRTEQRQVGAEGLAGELGRRNRLNDPPGVDQRVRGAELLDPLEEEGSLFREEELVPRVEDELLGVGLDLGEIRIGAAVQRQIVGDAPPDAPTQLGTASRLLPAAGPRRAGGPRGERWGKIEYYSPPQVGEPHQSARLRQK